MINSIVLPVDNPFDLSDDTIINLSECKFSDVFLENINTAFIYLRNIEYHGKYSFDGISFDDRCEILKAYMLRDIKQFSIPLLDNVILSLFVPYMSIPELFEYEYFTIDETMQFIAKNNDLCKDLFRFLVSIPDFILTIDDSQTFNFDMSELDHVEDVLPTYTCAETLLQNEYVNLLMFMPDELKIFDVRPVFYDRYFKYESTLTDLVRNLTFSRIYEDMIYDQHESDNSVLSC